MIVAKKILLEAVKTCRSFVKARTTNPLFACLRLTTYGTPALKITSCDGDRFCMQTVAVSNTSGESQDFLVNAQQFELMVGACGDDVMTTLNEKLLFIQSGSFTGEIPIQAIAEFPEFPLMASDSRITINCVELSKAVHGVAWAASQDEGRPELQSVHILFGAKITTIESTNGRQFAYVQMAAANSWQTPDVLIPAIDAIGLAIHLTMPDAMLFVMPNAVAVKNASGSIWLKQLAVKYPSWPQLYEQKLEKIATVDRREMLDICGSILGLPPKKGLSSDVEIITEFASVSLTSGNSDYKIAKEIGGGEDEAKFRMDSKYLTNALRACRSDKISLFKTVGAVSPSGLSDFLVIKDGDMTIINCVLRG